MIASFYGASVSLDYFIARKNGWGKFLDSFPRELPEIEKALSLLCPPIFKVLFSNQLKAKYFFHDTVPSDPPDTEVVHGKIDRIEIKIFYKE